VDSNFLALISLEIWVLFDFENVNIALLLK
jgi:hypothetical protein